MTVTCGDSFMASRNGACGIACRCWHCVLPCTQARQENRDCIRIETSLSLCFGLVFPLQRYPSLRQPVHVM